MGCASSDRKDASQQHREKMLVEYLKGIEAKQIKEMQAEPERNGEESGVPPHLLVGDSFIAYDSSRFEVVSIGINGLELLCFSCGIKVKQNKFNEHIESVSHQRSL